MRLRVFFLGLVALWAHIGVFALLEEKIVSFAPGNGSFDIAGATILADAEDFVGVHIALKSLVNDLEQITGTRPAFRNITSNSTVFGNSTSLASGPAIIIGSTKSSLVRELSNRNVVDISDIEGKWEVFKTVVITNPFAGMGKALMILGSDKRGTIFGVHTLAEQCGQSP
jgi:hypothetical protein